MLPHFLQVKITYAMFILCYKLAMDNLSTILVTNETVTTNKQPVRSESGSSGGAGPPALRLSVFSLQLHDKKSRVVDIRKVRVSATCRLSTSCFDNLR